MIDLFMELQTVASRESFAAGNEKSRANGNANYCDEVDGIQCSRATQDKRTRKTSTVCVDLFSHIIARLVKSLCL